MSASVAPFSQSRARCQSEYRPESWSSPATAAELGRPQPVSSRLLPKSSPSGQLALERELLVGLDRARPLEEVRERPPGTDAGTSTRAPRSARSWPALPGAAPPPPRASSPRTSGRSFRRGRSTSPGRRTTRRSAPGRARPCRPGGRGSPRSDRCRAGPSSPRRSRAERSSRSGRPTCRRRCVAPGRMRVPSRSASVPW